jgi:hypothetical protein
MAKYNVKGWMDVYVSAVVEADTPEEAVKKAWTLKPTEWKKDDHGVVLCVRILDGKRA